MLNIQPIESEPTWNNFLLQQNSNTFLQSWQWGSLQATEEEKVRYLGIFNGTQQIGAGLLITVAARRGKFLLCPHGPIITKDEHSLPALTAYVEYARNIAKEDQAVALKIAPLFIANVANQKMFQDLGFRPAPLHIHTEETWILNINQSPDQLLAGMRKTTRHAIRKAEKEGVRIEITRDPLAINRFWPLYEKTKTRHDFTPFPKTFLEKQFTMFNKDADHAYLAIATHQNQDVAAGMFIQFGKTVFYHHGASKQLSSKISPTQLLQWRSIREAISRGATRYNFWGIAPENSPSSHPFAGITTFKKGFGGQAINYLHAQDLPLSWRYWPLWFVDTYRKTKRGF